MGEVLKRLEEDYSMNLIVDLTAFQGTNLKAPQAISRLRTATITDGAIDSHVMSVFTTAPHCKSRR